MTKQGFKINKKIFSTGLGILLLLIIPVFLGAVDSDDLKKQLRKSTENNQKASLAEEIASSYFNTNHDSVFKYFSIAQNFANKSETKEDDIKIYRSFAYFHTHRTNDFAEANEHYLKALKIAESSENLLEQALIYNDLGIVGWKQGKYLPAVENYYKANELLPKVKDSDLEIRVSLSLGIVHNESAMNDEAKVFYARGLKLAEQNDNQKAVGMFLNNLGKIHRDLEEYDL